MEDPAGRFCLEDPGGRFRWIFRLVDSVWGIPLEDSVGILLEDSVCGISPEDFVWNFRLGDFVYGTPLGDSVGIFVQGIPFMESRLKILLEFCQKILFVESHRKISFGKSRRKILFGGSLLFQAECIAFDCGWVTV